MAEEKDTGHFLVISNTARQESPCGVFVKERRTLMVKQRRNRLAILSMALAVVILGVLCLFVDQLCKVKQKVGQKMQ